MSDIYEKLSKITDTVTGESMSIHTTFKAGGPADYYVVPHNSDEVADIIRLCKKECMPYIILGGGSNMLFTKKGYRGIVIHIGKLLSDIQVKDNVITAYAGAKLPAVSIKAAESGLSGLEFAAGIPGSVGGAVVMNAGAYGGEIKDVIAYADVCDSDGNIITLSADELKLGYRTSVISEKGYTVIRAGFKLNYKDSEEIKTLMNDYNERRRQKQPLEYASAGSTFKRPKGYFAGSLIEQCGLKGYSCNDAMVSEKHAGFVINKAAADSDDILNVIQHVIDTVYEKTNVKLEPEVKIIGER